MKFIIALLFISACATAHAQEAFKDYSPREFNDQLGNSSNIILDVRTAEELKNEGVIAENVIQIDYFVKDFVEQVSKLDKSKTYLIYCASGARSGETVELMKKSGFKSAHNLAGGTMAWKKAKLPMVPFKSSRDR